MAFRSVQRQYNDPGLASVGAGLASLFAPPDAGDVANYARARSLNQDTDYKNEYIQKALNGGLTDDQRDIYLTGAAGLSPTQGFGARNMTDATNQLNIRTDAETKRRADDMASADRRFDTTTQSGDRRFNTTETNEVARQKAILDASMGVIKDRTVVGKDVTVNAISPEEAAALSGGDPVLAAALQLQGKGIVSPRTAAEVEGAFTEQGLADGTIDPAQYRGAKVLNAPTVEGIDPATGKARIYSQGQAAALGVAPAPKAGSNAFELYTYKAPDGSVGPATYDQSTGGWVITGTNMPVPAGSVPIKQSTSDTSEGAGIGPQKGNILKGNDLHATIDAAEAATDQALAILSDNKNAAGVPARVKGIAQSIASSAAQVTEALGDRAPEAQVSLEEARSAITGALGSYDPQLVELAGLMSDLTYARASIGNSSGEVSRYAFEEALKSFGTGMFDSQQDLKTGLENFRKTTLRNGRIKADSLLGKRYQGGNVPQGGGTTPAAGAPAGATVPTYGRDASGKIVRTN